MTLIGIEYSFYSLNALKQSPSRAVLQLLIGLIMLTSISILISSGSKVATMITAFIALLLFSSVVILVYLPLRTKLLIVISQLFLLTMFL